ncbi:MAG TPA: hypothetical protein VMR94_06075, partial [Hyphomicrobiaceae bacterium]|nr:hypothetical protein [Hyphomicrobiaceae bacterium]
MRGRAVTGARVARNSNQHPALEAAPEPTRFRRVPQEVSAGVGDLLGERIKARVGAGEARARYSAGCA